MHCMVYRPDDKALVESCRPLEGNGVVDGLDRRLEDGIMMLASRNHARSCGKAISLKRSVFHSVSESRELFPGSLVDMGIERIG